MSILVCGNTHQVATKNNKLLYIFINMNCFCLKDDFALFCPQQFGTIEQFSNITNTNCVCKRLIDFQIIANFLLRQDVK